MDKQKWPEASIGNVIDQPRLHPSLQGVYGEFLPEGVRITEEVNNARNRRKRESRKLRGK